MKYLFIFITTILFAQCAQQSPLGGGEKDTTAPMVDTIKLESPLNESVNFNTNQIIINFDELVVLNNPDKQILVTPFLDTKPDIYAKGKKIIVDFKEPLKEHTTYIINFGNAIVDITEGNPIKNYKYVFSTGSYIDSLSYEAVVYDAYTKKPAIDTKVLLYKSNEDSIVEQKKPKYFGITDQSGKVRIQNIGSGAYKVVALFDENENYLFNSKTEKIGFTEDLFRADKDTIPDTLVVFQNVPNELAVMESKVRTNGKGFLVLNGHYPDGEINISDTTLKVFLDNEIWFSNDRDSIYFWLNPTLPKGEKYKVQIPNLKAEKVFVPTSIDTSIHFKTNASEGLRPMEDLFFVFDQPIQKLKSQRIDLFKGEELISFEANLTKKNQLIISSDWEENQDYRIKIWPGTVVSEYEVVNDTIEAFFEVKEESQYGNLFCKIDVSDEDAQYILHLLKNEKVYDRGVCSKSELTDIEFLLLEPGNYGVRLIYDENKNGLWDSGDYYQHKQPERVEYYADPIEIRKGWDMEISWQILK